MDAQAYRPRQEAVAVAVLADRESGRRTGIDSFAALHISRALTENEYYYIAVQGNDFSSLKACSALQSALSPSPANGRHTYAN